MKYLMFFVILLIPFYVSAEPFLVSDPYPVCGESGQPSCPVEAECFEDGVSIASGISLQPDYSIRYDLGSMPTGEHEYTCTYTDGQGRVSVLSDPFVQLRQGPPPLGLRMVPQ